jgi:DNA-binding beta-propeller fold protein YncE
MRSWRRMAVGGVAALAFVAGAPVAHATGTLPLTDFGGLVVDNVHKRLFVTGGESNNTVVVTDFSGSVKKTITNQFGASGMVLSADSSTLYVALASGDAISALDTVTYAEKARYATGPQTCPTHLTRTDRYVWFGYGCDNVWNGRIGKLDTGATPPALALDQQGDARFQKAPFVTAAAAGPLLAGQLELSQSSVHVYTVDAGALRPGPSGGVAGSNLTDVSLTPDGTTFFTAAGSRDQVDGFATADLSRRGGYPTGTYPNAVAVSPDGRYLATGVHTTGDDITVFKLGTTSPVDSFSFSGTLTQRSLAWSADGRKLFAVTHVEPSSAPTLRVVNYPLS